MGKNHQNDSAALTWMLEGRLKKRIPSHCGCTSGYTVGSTRKREKLGRWDWLAGSPPDVKPPSWPCLTRLGNPPSRCSARGTAASAKEADIQDLAFNSSNIWTHKMLWHTSYAENSEHNAQKLTGINAPAQHIPEKKRDSSSWSNHHFEILASAEHNLYPFSDLTKCNLQSHLVYSLRVSWIFKRIKLLEVSRLPFKKSLQIPAPSHSLMVQYHHRIEIGERRLLMKMPQSANLKSHNQNRNPWDTQGLSELPMESEWLSRR